MPRCYGIQKGKFIVNPTSFPAYSVISGNRDVSINSSSGSRIDYIVGTTSSQYSNYYRVYDFSNYTPLSGDYVQIPTEYCDKQIQFAAFRATISNLNIKIAKKPN